MKCNDSIWNAMICYEKHWFTLVFSLIFIEKSINSSHWVRIHFFLESMAYFTLKVAFYVATFLVTFLYKFQHFSYELQHFLYKFWDFFVQISAFVIYSNNFFMNNNTNKFSISFFLCSIYYVEIVFYIISRLICFLRSIMAVSCCHRCIYW